MILTFPVVDTKIGSPATRYRWRTSGSSQSGEARGARLSQRLAFRPGQDPHQVDGRGNDQVLEVSFLHAAVAAPPHAKGSHALRNRSLQCQIGLGISPKMRRPFDALWLAVTLHGAAGLARRLCGVARRYSALSTGTVDSLSSRT